MVIAAAQSDRDRGDTIVFTCGRHKGLRSQLEGKRDGSAACAVVGRPAAQSRAREGAPALVPESAATVLRQGAEDRPQGPRKGRPSVQAVLDVFGEIEDVEETRRQASGEALGALRQRAK